MTTAQDSTLTPTGAHAAAHTPAGARPSHADAHRHARRAVTWAVRIGLLAILFTIPLAAYL
jgi:hypothetical protein